MDRDGENLLPVQAGDLQEKSHYLYVFNTLQLGWGQVYLSDITINHEEGAHAGLHKPIVRMDSPVLGDNGKVQGLIVINLERKADAAMYLAKESGGNRVSLFRA